MKSLITLIIVFVISLYTFAQTPTPTPGITVGLLHYSDDCKVSEGYTLYTPSQSDKVYLIDNCGYLINEWTFNNSLGYPSAYLLPDGSVAKLTLLQSGGSPYGNYHIERRDWNDSLMWDFAASGRYAPIHSDFAFLPNGNFLAIVQDIHTAADALAKGIDPASFSSTFNSESIVEFQPTGLTTGDVVWEWHLWDHLVQDYNPLVTETYASNIADFPNKMDANLLNTTIHFNSIWYLEDRDHVIMSSWRHDEILIVDHNISSVEAADSLGDFLWRWGNPENYGAGTIADKRLDGMHNPRLVPLSYPLYAGKFSVHNNLYHNIAGLGSNRSAAVILDDVYDPVSGSYPMDPVSGSYLPADFEYVWYGDVFVGDSYYSLYESGVQVQSNGNILLTEALEGRMVEVTPNGEVVWIYKTPANGSGVFSQGNNSNGDIYKSEKYQTSYSGILFDTPGSLVENNNSISVACAANVVDSLDAEIIAIQNNFTSLQCLSNVAPEFQLSNYGLTDIDSVTFEYSVNNGAVSQYQWTGLLEYCNSELINIPDVLLSSNEQIDITILSVNGSTDNDLTNNSSSIVLPSAKFTDSGNISSNYSNNETETYVICPNNPYLEVVELTFTHVDIDVFTFGTNQTDPCGDYLNIYNGNSVNAPILAEQLCGELSGTGQTPPNAINLIQTGDVFTSSDSTGCLTVFFRSDGSDTDDGWEADINCISNGNNCPLSLNISNTILAGIYQADDLISSDGKIDAGSGGNVSFLAGDLYIDLITGFEADGTFDFSAEIFDCDTYN